MDVALVEPPGLLTALSGLRPEDGNEAANQRLPYRWHESQFLFLRTENEFDVMNRQVPKTSSRSSKNIRVLKVHDKGLGLILSIGKTMLEAKSLADVLNTIVTGAMELTHTDSGVIFLLDADGKHIIDKFHPLGGFKHPDPRLDNKRGITRQILSTRQIVSFRDISHNTRVNPALKARYKCMFGIPLLQGSFVLGVLYLNGKNSRELTKTERSLLLAFVDHAVLAIQIKNAEAMYHAIPQCVFLKDLQSRFRAANSSFCNSLAKQGRSVAERDLIGKSDYDFYKKETADTYVARDKEVIESGTKREWIEPHPGLRGEPMSVQVVKTPVLDAAHHVVGVQAIFWDVTHQEHLRHRWESLVEQSPDSVVVHERGKITFANAQALLLFGVSDFQQLENRSIYEFIDRSYHRFARRRLRLLNQRKHVKQGVAMKVRRVSGDVVNVEVYSSPGPRDTEVQVVFHDLTRRQGLMAQIKETNRRLEKSLAIQGHLLQEAHHRIKNNLLGVSSFLDLKGEELTDDKAKRLLHDCSSHIHVMMLIHKKLARSTYASTIAIKEYLSELIDWVSHVHRAHARQIRCSCDIQDVNLPFADIVPCVLAIHELVTNSFKHAFPDDRPGFIYVSLHADELHNMTVTVTDDGVGLPRNINLSSPKSLGMELVSRWVRKQLQGSLHVRRRHGTVFTIRFRSGHEARKKRT